MMPSFYPVYHGGVQVVPSYLIFGKQSRQRYCGTHAVIK